MIFVTAINRRYMPGAVALWNSFKHYHKDGRDQFVCVAFGDASLGDELAATGMEVRLNPDVYDDEQVFPAPGVWQRDVIDKDALRALYFRCVLPELFPEEKRVVWVDADSNFIDGCGELEHFDMQGKVVAAPLTAKRPKIYLEMGKPQKWKNIITGTMLFDVQQYIERGFADQMMILMDDYPERFDDSSCNCAINYILEGERNVKELPRAYCYNAKRKSNPIGAKILHWSICEPWDCADKPQEIQNQIEKYWEPFA